MQRCRVVLSYWPTSAERPPLAMLRSWPCASTAMEQARSASMVGSLWTVLVKPKRVNGMPLSPLPSMALWT